jgi:antirestriction protein ArdC
MEDSTKFGKPQVEPRADIRREITDKLTAAMEEGNTPWQRPWSAQSMNPQNAVTTNGYRGINRVLLSLAGAQYGDNRWLTFDQAASHGWKVKKGSKAQMIVKVVEMPRDRDRPSKPESDSRQQGQAGESQSEAKEKASMALRRYWVFNAEQVEGIPKLAIAAQPDFDPEVRAENLFKALKEKTNLLIVHGGNSACYVPGKDEVRLPHKRAFGSNAYEYYSTACHEFSHATMSENRLARRDALGKRWGDAAYSLEELRAEISAAYLCVDLGIAGNIAGQGEAQSEAARLHTQNHGAYLKSWLEVLKKDPQAIFSAAKDADLIAGYLLNLEREWTAMQEHKEWVREFDGEAVAR